MHQIQEHSIKILAELSEKDVSKKMEVFYNPVMASHRNIAILLLNSLPNTHMNIADPLAGSGVRSLRFLKELKPEKIAHLYINDKKENFKKVFDKNLCLNKLQQKKKTITVENIEANKFLTGQHDTNFCGYFDYVDVDPFGSPNPFLGSAVERVKRGGILAVTATDTAALSGTYEKVTKRKYWAKPLRNYLMHEIGLRILIRKVQLQGIQFDKALVPLLAYQKEHYFRIYFRAEKGKENCDKLLKQHQYFLFCHDCLSFKTSQFNKESCSCGRDFAFAGPLWMGRLFDKEVLQKMLKENPFPEEQKFLERLVRESKIDVPGFYDLHVLARKHKKELPRMEEALKKLQGVRTHFSMTGVKTKKGVREVLKVLK